MAEVCMLIPVSKTFPTKNPTINDLITQIELDELPPASHSFLINTITTGDIRANRTYTGTSINATVILSLYVESYDKFLKILKLHGYHECDVNFENCKVLEDSNKTHHMVLYEEYHVTNIDMLVGNLL